MSVSNPLPSAEDLTTFARIAAFISDEKRRMAALDDTQKAIAAYNDAIAANAAKIEAAQVELEKLERVRQAADAHAADLAAREAKLAEGQRVLEPGAFDLLIGPSSRDRDLQKLPFTVMR